MTELPALYVIIEIAIGILVGRHTLIMNKQKELLADQKDILRDIDAKIDKRFQKLESRVDNLLEEFDREIKATTSINYEMSQVLQGTRAQISESLVKVDGALQDLKKINIGLLVDTELIKRFNFGSQSSEARR